MAAPVNATSPQQAANYDKMMVACRHAPAIPGY